jgi:hypothetical protein
MAPGEPSKGANVYDLWRMGSPLMAKARRFATEYWR